MHASIPPTLPSNLADIFPAEAVIFGLQQRTKAGVISELVHRLIETNRIAPGVEQSLIQMILAREKMGSTGLGNGVAFPHCRSSVTETFVGAVAIDADGVSFDALDLAPVHLMFLLIGPLTNREQHFDVLGRISGIGRHRPVRLQLCGCRSAEEVNRILRDLDSESDTLGNLATGTSTMTKHPFPK